MSLGELLSLCVLSCTMGIPVAPHRVGADETRYYMSTIRRVPGT